MTKKGKKSQKPLYILCFYDIQLKHCFFDCVQMALYFLVSPLGRNHFTACLGIVPRTVWASHKELSHIFIFEFKGFFWNVNYAHLKENAFFQVIYILVLSID